MSPQNSKKRMFRRVCGESKRVCVWELVKFSLAFPS